MRARIGDLAIARFDSSKRGKDWDERVCLVTGCVYGDLRRERDFKFIYWAKYVDSENKVITAILPVSRFVRVRPKSKWNGVLSTLTLKDVEKI